MSESKVKLDLLTKIKYLTIHCVSFSIFGLMCLGYMLIIPVIFFVFRNNDLKRYQVNQYLTHFGFRFVVWFCDKVGFIKIRLMNPEKRNHLKPVLVANHLTMFDIVAVFCYFPGYTTFVHRKFLKNPFLYPIIKSCGYIAVNPLCPSDRQKAMAIASDYLKQGMRLVIFPEGKRSKNGKLSPFQSGAFYLSVVNKVGISSIFFTCDQSFLNNQKMFIVRDKPIELNVWLMPEIPTDDLSADRKNVKKLKKDTELLYDVWMKSEKSLPWNKLESFVNDLN